MGRVAGLFRTAVELKPELESNEAIVATWQRAVLDKLYKNTKPAMAMQRCQEVVECSQPAAEEVNAALQWLANAKDAPDAPAMEKRLQAHRESVGKKLLAQRQSDVLRAPAHANFKSLIARVDDLKGWFPDSAPEQAKISDLSAIAKSRGGDQTALKARLNGTTAPALLGLMVQELWRTTPPERRAETVAMLAAAAKSWSEADQSKLQPALVELLRSQLQSPALNWADIAGTAKTISELVVNDPWVAVAAAEAAAERTTEPLKLPERDALAKALAMLPPLDGYRDYVLGILAANPADSAAKIQQAFEAGKASPELNNPARKARGASRLRSAALTRGNSPQCPLDDPLDDATKAKFAAWLDQAETLAPANGSEAWKANAVRAMAAWPDHPAKALALTAGIPDSAVAELGPAAAPALYIKFQSHAQNGDANQKRLALSTVERLIHLLESKYLRRPLNDPERMSAKMILDRVITPALEFAERHRAGSPIETLKVIAKIHGAKGRIMAENLHEWPGPQQSAALNEAVKALSTASAMDKDSSARPFFIVDHILARSQELRTKPSLDEQGKVANQATDIDPENYIGTYLKALAKHQSAEHLTDLPRDRAQKTELTREAIRYYEDTLPLVQKSDHPSRKVHEANMLWALGRLNEWMANKAPTAGNKTERDYRAAARKWMDQLKNIPAYENPAALAAYARYLQNRAAGGDADKWLADAEAVMKFVVESSNDPMLAVELIHAAALRSAFGRQSPAELDQLAKSLNDIAMKSDRPQVKAEALALLAQIRRWQRQPDAASLAAEATKLAPNDLKHWGGRIAAAAGQPTELNAIADELSSRRDDEARQLGRLAAGAARLARGPTPASEMATILGLPSTFPNDLGPLSADNAAADEALPLVVAWLENWLKVGVSSVNDDAIRRLTDAVVRVANREAQRDLELKALALILAARVRLKASEPNDALKAREWWSRAEAMMNNNLPIVAEWRDAFNKEAAAKTAASQE
jgi:hypothetical protein